MKTDHSSNPGRVVIYITLPSQYSYYFGGALLNWMFKGGGWKPRESSKGKQLVKDDKLKSSLLAVLRDMKTGIYSEETEKAFKRIGLPIQFKVDNISQAYSEPGQEQLIVSGSGNESKFVKWLNKKQIKHEVRYVSIQKLL